MKTIDVVITRRISVTFDDSFKIKDVNKTRDPECGYNSIVDLSTELAEHHAVGLIESDNLVDGVGYLHELGIVIDGTAPCIVELLEDLV